MGHAPAAAGTLARLAPPVDIDEDADNHSARVAEAVQQLLDGGCTRPLLDTEIADPETAEVQEEALVPLEHEPADEGVRVNEQLHGTASSRPCARPRPRAGACARGSGRSS